MQSAFFNRQLDGSISIPPINGVNLFFDGVLNQFRYRLSDSTYGVLGGGGVSEIMTGTGLTGGPITASGTISLANTSVIPGSYTAANITIDAQGRITSASSGSGTGTGTVTTISVASANGFAGSVSDPTTTPIITLSTSVVGILKGSGTGLIAAISGTDYELPLSFTTGLTRSSNTISVNTTQNISELSNLTTNGFVRTSGSDGTLYIDTGTYLTANQTITISNDITGTGTTTISATIGTNKVTYAKMQQASAAILLGNPTGGVANIQEITLGSGLAFSGTTLIATGSGSGSVTSVTSADGNATVASSTTTPVITIVSAPKWTTAIALAGNDVDGSGNVAFANKFIVQGTSDSGLSSAQFLGLLATGIVKNTTTTGVLSIAVAADFPTLNQSTSGNAATATVLQTARTINGVYFDGSSNITVTAAAGTLTGTTLNSTVVSSSLTSLGTVVSGGIGTGAVIGGVTMTLTSDASYDMYYRSATGVLTRLANGTTGQILTATTSSAPSWELPSTSGTVTTVSVASANGFAGTVATSTSTPIITITTTITGIIKGNGTSISAASAGTDYSAGTSSLSTGILKSTTATGVLSIAVAADFPTLNQNTTGSAATLATPRNINGVAFDGSASITITAAPSGGAGGDLTGTYPNPTIDNNKVTYAKMQQASTVALLGNPTGSTANVSEITLGSGLAFSGTTLTATGSGGTVTTVSVASANGFAGTTATATSTPVITLTTTVTGIIKGNGTAISSASASDITGQILTGYSSGSGTISASDSLLSAIQKLNGNIGLLAGSVIYQGTWNASTNTPTLISGTGTKGWYYKVSVAGTTTLDGISQWNANDTVIFDGTAWDKIDGISSEVVSVNGLVGAVALTGTAGQIDISGSNVFSIDSGYTGQTSITTLGIITAGTWNGTSISNSYLVNSSVTINGTPIALGAAATVAAAAATLTGTTLNSTVVTSSLTTIGTLIAGSIPYILLTGAPSSLPPSGSASGDLTGSYPGPTVGTNKITYAKMQQASTLVLLGNPTGGTANISEITLGSGLSFSGTTLVATGSGGSVTSVSVTSANGFAGTVATSTSTPAITISTTVTGILKGNGTAISAATAGTDYQVPLSFTTGLSISGSNIVTVNTSQNITVLSNLTTNGFVKTSGGIGTLSIESSLASSDIPTLTGGQVGTSGLAANAVTYAKMQSETASTLLGNPTGGGAVPSEITLGSGLSFSGTTLVATGSGGTVTSVTSATGAATVASSTTTPVITIVSAPKWTTAVTLAGNSVDGSGNVAFANKFIVQGTSDSGLSSAQFLGALGTGIVKNTTTTGVLSIAVAADFPTLNQNSTGTASNVTGIVLPANGGTGIANNTNNTITFTGNYTLGLTLTASTSVTLPTSGTLVNTAVTALSSLVTISTITSGGLGTGATIGGVTMTFGSDASYDMYYRSATGVLTRLANGTTGQVLTATTSSAPSWELPSASGTVTSIATSGGITGGTITTTGTISLANITAYSVLANITGSSGTPSAALSYTTTGAASSLLQLDANANATSNNVIQGVTSTTTAASTTTLVATSTYEQDFTGTSTQIVKLPVTSTLAIGFSFLIVNTSTGAVTVNSSGSNLVQTIASSGAAVIKCIGTTHTTAADWEVQYMPPYTNLNTASTIVSRDSSGNFSAGTITATLSGNATTVTTNANLTGPITSSGNATSIASQTGTGTTFVMQASPTITTPAINGISTGTGVSITSAVSTLVLRDTSANISSNNLFYGYTTTVTSGTTVTLTVASAYYQFFTGSTAQTVVLPVASTMQLGGNFFIENNSTATITINSSGANLVVTIPAGTNARIECILISGTSAASWNVDYFGTIIANGKYAAFNNSITLAGTDSTTMTFPSTSATIARTDAGQTFTGSSTATSWTLVTPALGTPSSGTLTSCTGLPISTGVSGLATGIAAFLATPSSANFASAITDETGSAGHVVFSVSPTVSNLTLSAGSTSSAPLVLTSGTDTTTPVAGAIEYDGVQFYNTVDTTGGRGAMVTEQYFHLTTTGSTISTIANYFGTTSNISLVSGAYYEIDIYLYYLKSTAGTVTWTLTNSAAPTSQNIYYEMSPVTGIVAPPGSAGTMLQSQIYGGTTAAQTVVTGSLTTAVNHYAYFKIFIHNGTGTSLKIQATCSAGTITPGINSYWFCKRLSSSNVGTFAS